MDTYRCPYDDLYIYYLQGLVGNGLKRFGPNFIGNWEEDGFSFLFFSRPSEKVVDDLTRSRDGLCLLDAFHMPYDQWQGERLAPFEAGGLCIAPPWMASAHGERQILLDPGVVFGAGTHATTRDCLDAIALACRESSVDSLLDLGTGTGVLALAAARLGCRRVVAVDFNRLAAETAWRNVQLNRMADRIAVIHGRAEETIASRTDLLVANIHFDVMKDLVAADAFLTKRCFVLSGLLRSQAKQIEDDLRRLPVKILNRWNRDGIWHTFYGTVDSGCCGRRCGG